MLPAVELVRASRELRSLLLNRRPRFGQLLFAFGERGLGLLELERSGEQRRLALCELTLTKLDCVCALLDLGLATRQDLVGVRVVGVRRSRSLGATEPQRSARRIWFLELARPALDLELAPCDVGSPLAQRALQVLYLDEIFGALPFALLGEPAGELQHLVPIEVILLRPGFLPPGRLPGVLRFHPWSVARD